MKINLKITKFIKVKIENSLSLDVCVVVAVYS